VAKKEGYVPLPCASGADTGSMGIHYVNLDLLGDGALDIAKPEAVLYEPQKDGSMKLMAVEYITEKGRPRRLADSSSTSPTSPTATAAAVLRAACVGLDGQPDGRVLRH